MSVQEMAKIMRPGLCKIVEENEMNNGALLRAAHKHNIFELKEYCTEYLKHKISLENATDILVSSHITDRKDLFEIASDFVKFVKFVDQEKSGKLVKSDLWEELKKTNHTMATDIRRHLIRQNLRGGRGFTSELD